MNVLNDADAEDLARKLIAKQKIDNLRLANGKEWQSRLGLSQQIPVTVVLADGKVRVLHEAVMADPVLFLEADLKALEANTGSAK